MLIHEITDLECGYCAKVQPTLERILQTYPEDMALVWVDSPLPQHDGAVVAAEAAREVRAQRGDAAFWTFTSRLFANQRVFAAADLADDA